VLNDWVDQGPTVTTKTFTAGTAGSQALVIECYENTGTATALFVLTKIN
jgi:hypothetical protein